MFGHGLPALDPLFVGHQSMEILFGPGHARGTINKIIQLATAGAWTLPSMKLRNMYIKVIFLLKYSYLFARRADYIKKNEKMWGFFFALHIYSFGLNMINKLYIAIYILCHITCKEVSI